MRSLTLMPTVVSVAIGCGLFEKPVLAQGRFEGPGLYEITNLKSGKVIDLDRNDQTTVIQFSSRGTDNQTWDIRPAGQGYYYVRNLMNGYALDSGHGGNSTPVHGVPFNGSDSQQWRLEMGKDGNALIMSRLGKTLDIPGGTSRDGAPVHIYDLNGDSNQRFMFRRVWERRSSDWDDREDRLETRPITCSSNDGKRVYCQADTRGAIQLLRQISGSTCLEGETWGYDPRGIWVDRGCRAEFMVSRARRDFSRNTIICSSDNGERVYCEVDTHERRVELVQQMSGSLCSEGETWGWDRQGIWVDRGCRAEFALRREY